MCGYYSTTRIPRPAIPESAARQIPAPVGRILPGIFRLCYNPPMQSHTRGTQLRLVLGFFLLLYGVGGGLIWLFYGQGAAVLGMSCITAGLFLFLLLYAIVWLLGKWAGE